MSKYRCPVCGAAHKQQPEKCRLCGQDMGGPNTVPIITGARQVVTKRSGLTDLGLIAVAGVAAIALLAVGLGFTGSSGFVDNIRERIPGLAPDRSDGWQPLDDADGGFVAQMPEDRTKQFAPFTPGQDGRLEQWVAPIGWETELSIYYARLATPPTDDAWRPYLEELADTWAQSLGGRAEDITERAFRGHPGMTTTVEGLRMLDPEGNLEVATAKAWLVLRGETLYLVQSLSVYRDHPNFERLAGSIEFT
jgi:hypothetical protein